MGRRIMIIAAGVAMLAMGLPSPLVVANDPGSPRGTQRLKSGGTTSQQDRDDPPFLGDTTAADEGQPLQWSKNVNVFPNPFEQDEPTIAFNPRDAENIVIGNHERQGLAPAAIVCAFQASFDEGSTWTRFGSTPLQGPLFPAANGHSCSDSVLAADGLGDFYFAYLDLFRATAPLRVDLLVAKSSDGGQSFPTFASVARGVGSGLGAEDPDKEWIEVDRHPQSPHRGNVYVTYSDFSTFTIKFRKSVNGGATYLPAPTAFGTVVSDLGFQDVALFPCAPHTCFTVTTRYMQGSNISVGPRGEIHVFYGDFTEIETFDHTSGDAFVNAQMTAAKIMVATSRDEGSTWSRSIVRDMCSPASCRSAGTDSHETKNTTLFRVGTIPFGGVGQNGKFVYAVWGEWNSVTFSFDPFTNRDFAVSGGIIMFARSSDGGATWEPAIRVNDDTTTKDKFFPAMFVQPQGDIHVVWADRRLDPNGVNYDIFYATSVDNGRSFASNVRVTTASSNPRGTRFIGDYIDIDGSRGKIRAVWTDRRSVSTTASSAANDVFTAERVSDDH